MQQLARPTAALIQAYVKRFNDGNAGVADNALEQLFRAFPRNIDLEHVLLKVVALNTLYATGILAVVAVAEQILCHNIDGSLVQGIPELVNQIAMVEVKEAKVMRFYSFASKYCAWHMPDHYPIYDSFVDKLLWEYQRCDRFSSFRREDLRDYPTFKRVIEVFRQTYGLSDCSYKDLDKFLWMYGKECFPVG